MPVKLPFWLNLNTLSAAIIAGLIVFIGVQKIALLQCKLQNQKYSTQIQSLSDKSREKQSEVREVIRQGKDRVVVVEREAKRVESAPLEGWCRTPKLVLEADI